MFAVNHPILLAVVILSTAQDIFATECVVTNHPKTRTFDSLVAYQGNKIYFDPRRPNSMGNYVELAFEKIDNLPKNSFFAFDSSHVIKLSVNNKSLERIFEGAFLSLTCLKYLELKDNNLTRISRYIFDGLPNLNELDLSGNSLKNLPDLSFALLTRLTYLNLRQNEIQYLQPLTFLNLTTLQTLNLEMNKLRKFSPEVFQPLINLIDLNLGFNKLATLEPHKWPLPSLQTLNLCKNGLDSFDPSYNFSFSQLKRLNLSSNYLSQLNIYALRLHLPELGMIDLNDNNWFCEDLDLILHQLADTKITHFSHNLSPMSESGIDCINISAKYRTTTSKYLSTTLNTDAPNVNETTTVDYGGKIMGQNKELIQTNRDILKGMATVQNLLIVIFVFVVLSVLIYFPLRLGVCQYIRRRVTGNTAGGYIESGNMENFALLR